MTDIVERLIELYGMRPLPVEGTLFAETWRADREIEPGHAVGTSMIGLYCNEPLSQSRFHRLTVDEVWHFHAGDPLRLILLFPDGSSRDVLLGPDPLKGHRAQFVVPAGVWQAGHVAEGGEYALYGCTLAPGFLPSIFEPGHKATLLASHPDRAEDIARFGCASGE